MYIDFDFSLYRLSLYILISSLRFKRDIQEEMMAIWGWHE